MGLGALTVGHFPDRQVVGLGTEDGGVTRDDLWMELYLRDVLCRLSESPERYLTALLRAVIDDVSRSLGDHCGDDRGEILNRGAIVDGDNLEVRIDLIDHAGLRGRVNERKWVGRDDARRGHDLWRVEAREQFLLDRDIA